MQKRHVVTSWPISFFWVFLSIATAILASYSFLQADWVIKRNLVITNYYQPDHHNNNNNATTTTHSSPPDPLQNSPPPFPPDRVPGLMGNELMHHSPPPPPPAPPQRRIVDHHENRVKYSKKTNSHHRNNNNNNYNSSSSNNDGLHHSHLVDILYENYGQFSGESRAGLHVRRVIKVTKVVTTVRFGTIGVCSSAESIARCHLYTGHDPFPVSSIWGMVTIIGGSGCMTLCVSAVLSLLAVALPSSHLRHQVATTIGHAQTVAVVLLFLSLLLFPLGFDSAFVRYHCGILAGPYNIADCEIGWAYALVLVCASLALYCPVLVKFTADIRYNTLPKYL